MAASGAWKQAVSSFLRSAPMISMYGGVTVTAMYVGYKDYSRKQRMLVAYKSGNILPPYKENKYEVRYQRRPREESQLKSIFSNNFTNEYYLIFGEVGVGKTRTIVEVIRELAEQNGSRKKGAPVYVSVDQGKSFPDTLAQAVNFSFDEHISFGFFLDIIWRVESFPKKDEQSKLVRVLDAIEDTSFSYMLETGKPVVLVIDGINNLNKQMDGALERLHDKAKLWADANIVKVVFVNNEEEVEQTLQKNSSSWSRTGYCLVIDDLTRSEAIDFLMTHDLLENETCEDRDCIVVGKEDAENVVDLVGGRILDLIAFKRQFAKNVTLAEISEELKSRVREKFIRVSRTPSTWDVVSMLRRSPGKVMKLSKLIKCTSKEDVTLLLNHNIIRYVRDDIGTLVKFSSTLIENVVEEMESVYLQEKNETFECKGKKS